MTKLEINRYEINHAVNQIQEFIRLVVNGIEVVQDEFGNNSVRIVHHESKKLIRELEPEELMAVVANCNALMSLTQQDV
jgi:uncharacterized FlaG/YvyC family protein